MPDSRLPEHGARKRSTDARLRLFPAGPTTRATVMIDDGDSAHPLTSLPSRTAALLERMIEPDADGTRPIPPTASVTAEQAALLLGVGVSHLLTRLPKADGPNGVPLIALLHFKAQFDQEREAALIELMALDLDG